MPDKTDQKKPPFVMSGEPCLALVRYDDDDLPYFLDEDVDLSGEPRFVVVRYDDDGLPHFLSQAFDFAEKLKEYPDAQFSASVWNAVQFNFRSGAQSRADRIAGATVECIDVARWPAPIRPEGK